MLKRARARGPFGRFPQEPQRRQRRLPSPGILGQRLYVALMGDHQGRHFRRPASSWHLPSRRCFHRTLLHQPADLGKGIMDKSSTAHRAQARRPRAAGPGISGAVACTSRQAHPVTDRSQRRCRVGRSRQCRRRGRRGARRPADRPLADRADRHRTRRSKDFVPNFRVEIFSWREGCQRAMSGSPSTPVDETHDAG